MPELTKVTVGDLVFDVHLDGPADGPPIVLLHGFPQTARSWRAVARDLAADGMRVVAPDQRGYSPGARPAAVDAYRIEVLASDVAGIVDALDLGSVHLVGHDWGASVAWYLAAHHRDRVRSLTALSVPHLAAFGRALREDDDQRHRSEYMRLFRRAGKAEAVLLADDARRLRAMYGTAVAPADIDHHVRALSRPGALTAALNWYRAVSPGADTLPAVEVPTTYLWSTGDVAIGRAAAESCRDHVGGDYEFVVLDGISHWIPDEAPAAAVAAIRARTARTRAGAEPDR